MTAANWNKKTTTKYQKQKKENQAKRKSIQVLIADRRRCHRPEKDQRNFPAKRRDKAKSYEMSCFMKFFKIHRSFDLPVVNSVSGVVKKVIIILHYFVNSIV